MTNELQPFAEGVRGLPDPTDLRKALRAAVDRAYLASITARGEVTRPEDTFDVQRSLAAVRDLFADYARVFSDMRKLIGQLQEEQLIEAVGEQAGVPNQPLTVPDPEGDVRLGIDLERVHSIDPEQLIAVVSTHVTESSLALASLLPAVREQVRAEIASGIRLFLTLGKYEAQVTKVRSYAADLAREGSDDLASVVSGTIRTFTTYKGIKFERKKEPTRG